MTTTGNPAPPEFVRELHWSLRHLYDPTQLRRSHLIELLGLGANADPVAAIQRTLLQAIEALKPQSSVPPHASAWRVYHILNQRYAGQFGMSDIAINLAISGRQLRRLHAHALQALGDYLYTRYGLEQKVAGPRVQMASGPEEAKAPVPCAPTPEEELARVRSFQTGEPVEVAEAVQAVLLVAEPLIAASDVQVKTQLPAGLPSIAANRTAMRHALLSVLTATVCAVPGGSIGISAQPCIQQVWIEVRPVFARRFGSSTTVADAAISLQKENLDIASQLVTLFGGSLELLPGTGRYDPFVVRLVLPTVEQLPVLVVDDNADALRLFQLYLTGSRYRFVGVQDPRQAVEKAIEEQPCAIVLDLMLPAVDGWEILGRLREHPRTRGIPILVCTILPHKDLALALGAATLIRKPVSQQDFLAALDQHSGSFLMTPNHQTAC